ncbi:putative CMF receptor CMFR1 [Heterostelium album PN500]|uniref:Putative CMF receptor CMFR1 n=1 Tax=Heterostelium pallidum (strain ATCC 26659 / Pp 5 / PN500) TaxID=670386 RepID=D3AW13_HETP5|nr:putative CMF receptor CMFR1 [Heterostelium album PN500]EFA86486.1 putative CMF receptor CMFR1 [Heterostelium album PN500]|eukprot:XP_020438591.1 putative CMF receptor CMFR1 [Heterostelium album PN500]
MDYKTIQSTISLIQENITKVPVVQKVLDNKYVREHPVVAGVTAVGAGLLAAKTIAKVVKGTEKRYNFASIPGITYEDEIYDVAVIGAGPSGSTLSYYLAREGRKVAVLEKKKFPRDKFCGDAVATMAQDILREMGVMKELVDEDLGHFAQNGGFVSPNGNSFIGNSAKEMARDAKYNRGAVIAVKRIYLDEKIAKAAKRMGAELYENTTVQTCKFDRNTGLWTVECVGSEDNQPIVYRARCLVCADGSPSSTARALGYVNTEPNGICSRAYVKNNKTFKYDGVVFYPKSLLPGYCAIIREARDELNYLAYIIPGGKVQNEDLHHYHHDYIQNDPFISKALGPNPEIERMKAAPLRLGGIEKSYDDHMIIIGDAAGFIDPLTGEGIQYAMEGGKIGAEVLIKAFNEKDLSHQSLKRYQDRWMSRFGHEFATSMTMSLFLYRFPIVLDAAANLIGKRGARFLAEWAAVMTGVEPKTWFLRPSVGPFIVLEIFAECFRRLFKSKSIKNTENNSLDQY